MNGCMRNLSKSLTNLEKLEAYEDKVHSGHLGRTAWGAAFHLSLLDYTHLILMLQSTVKTNNLALFQKCNRDMANRFLAYDGPNYEGNV